MQLGESFLILYVMTLSTGELKQAQSQLKVTSEETVALRNTLSEAEQHASQQTVHANHLQGEYRWSLTSKQSC